MCGRGPPKMTGWVPHMTGFHVRPVPYAGDLPYLEIGLGKTMIFLTSRKTGTFDLYWKPSPMLTVKKRRAQGIGDQPAWAFLISNGRDEVYLHENVRRPTCTYRARRSPTEIHFELGESDARALAASMAAACGEPFSKLGDVRKARIKPQGLAHMHTADKQVLGFE